MRLLFIGDIVGKPGRREVAKWVPEIRKQFKIDRVIANYENIAHGFGLTTKIFNEMGKFIDIWTGGNHTFDRQEIIQLLKKESRLLRPLNYFEAPGEWYWEEEELVVISLMGIVGMPYGKNPFREIDKILEEKREEWKGKFVFIDFHAETTAEKNGFYHLVKGRAGAVVGTHTHIGTDDLSIEEGTLYLTDIGLTGCRDGVIGMDKVPSLYRFLTGLKKPFDVPSQCKTIFQGLIIETNREKAVKGIKVKSLNSETLSVTLKVEVNRLMDNS